MMMRCVGILFMACCGVTLSSAAEDREPSIPVRVLILTGEDYPGHQWERTTPVLRQQLSRDPRLQVEVLKDLSALRSSDLDPFAAVIMHFKNYDPEVPGRDGFDRLDAYVRQGGGLVLAHFACGAFEEFKPDFLKLAGRAWFGASPPSGRHQHDPYGPFTVSIADPNHPITQNLQNFETTDELYTCLEGSAPVEILATAVSRIDGKTYPMAFALRAGQGKVFHCVLGHDVRALETDGPGQLYRRGTAWAAGLDPAEL